VIAAPPPVSLAVSPPRIVLAAGETQELHVLNSGSRAAVAVSSATAAPGDRTAVVLLTSSPGGRGIGVSVRVGVLVVLRGAGGLVHRVVPLAVRRRGRRLELLLRNDGNAVEAVTRAAVRVDLLQRRRVVGRATAEPRELLPRTRGVSLLRLRTRARGLVSTRVEVRVGRSVLRRTFRVRLPG
jgi:hypothetical protein